MKTRTLTSLVQCLAIGVVAANLVVTIYRMIVNQDLFDITWCLVASMVGAAAGVLAAYSMMEPEETENQTAGSSEQGPEETALPEDPGAGSTSLEAATAPPLPGDATSIDRNGGLQEGLDSAQEAPWRKLSPEIAAGAGQEPAPVELPTENETGPLVPDATREDHPGEVAEPPAPQQAGHEERAEPTDTPADLPLEAGTAHMHAPPGGSDEPQHPESQTSTAEMAPAEESPAPQETLLDRERTESAPLSDRDLEVLVPAMDRQDAGPTDIERSRSEGLLPDVNEWWSAPTEGRTRPASADSEAIAALEGRILEMKRIEEGLRKQNDFLTLFLERAPAFLVVLDSNDTVRMMNRTLAEALGYAEDEVIGLEFTSHFVAPGWLKEARLTTPSIDVTDEAPVTIETPVSCKDRSEIPVEWRVLPVFDSNDQLEHCFLAGLDMSGRKKGAQPQAEDDPQYRQLHEDANKILARYRAALDLSSDPTILYDEVGTALYANPALTSTFGWTLEDLRGTDAPFVPLSQKELEKSAIEAIQRSGASYCELKTRRMCKDGRLLGTRLYASRLADDQGDSAGMVVVLREVAELPTGRQQPGQPFAEPPKKQISAKEIVTDIQSGATDAALMEKYKLTARGLQSVFQKILKAKALRPQEIHDRHHFGSYAETVAIELGRGLPKEVTKPQRKTIKSGQIKADVRAGSTDVEIMEKYGITSDGLDQIFNQMVAAGVVSADEVKRPPREPIAASLPHGQEHQPEVQEPHDETVKRALPRHYMVVSVPVYEADNLLSEGIIIDINDKGLQIQGIRTMKGETKAFLIQGDGFHDVYPFVFDAVCRWAKIDEATGDTVAGYEIIEISDSSLDELRKLISALSIAS
jgi:PAS domain S-box-containing protein